MLKYNVVDAGAFFRRDPIAHAEDAGAMPTQGFRPSSNSTRDCRLSADATIRVRVAPKARPCAGAVFDADTNLDVNWGRKPKTSQKARKRTAGRNARKRAARK